MSFVTSRAGRRILHAALWVAGLAPCAASASTLSVLYRDTTLYPYDLQAVRPVSGALIVVSAEGGASGVGEIFMLKPARAGQPWTKTVIHDFTGSGYQPGNPDGANPDSNLVADSSGNLWGLTESGAANSTGMIYKLTKPAAAGGSWTYSIIGPLPASFAYNGGNNAKSAYASALFDRSGNLDILAQTKPLFCGTTCGVLFQIPASALAGGSAPPVVLYNFSSATTGQNSAPPSGLIRSGNGDFFGYYYSGGTVAGVNVNPYGSVFELSPARGGGYTETILYAFCTVNNCTDGQNPSGLALSGTTLYGTYANGGPAPINSSGGQGGTFSLTKTTTGWSFKELYVLYGNNPGGTIRPDHGVNTPFGPFIGKNGGLVAQVSGGGDQLTNSQGAPCQHRFGGVVSFTLSGSGDSNYSNGWGAECFSQTSSPTPNLTGPQYPLSALVEAAPGVFYGTSEEYTTTDGNNIYGGVVYQIKTP